MKKKLLFFIACGTPFLSGCSLFTPYTLPIQQGKVISQNIMKEINPGLTKEQVKYMIGTPDLIDPFSRDQWNYIYSYQNLFDAPRLEKKLILIFKDNKLTQVSGDYSPPETIYIKK